MSRTSKENGDDKVASAQPAESMMPEDLFRACGNLRYYNTNDGCADKPARRFTDARQQPFSIKDVLSRDICIGCGACSIATDGHVHVTPNDKGVYSASPKDVSNLDPLLFKKADAVCPFSDAALNEDELDVPAQHSRSLPFDTSLGRYHAIFAGRQPSDAHLIGSSSGGLTSWLIKALLKSKNIDGVIHVGQAGQGDRLFEYRISYTLDEVDAYRKSAYYSTTLSTVLERIKSDSSKKFAIVGVPCFIKAARLLTASDPALAASISYFVGLVCGHMKSSFFAEANAWELGVSPDDIDFVDFRIKNANKKATQYEFSVKSKSSGRTFSKPASQFLSGNWGFGFFQPNACNYCDDVFAETADVVFGDAWLSKYKNDWRGTNIVVLRNTELANIFQEGISNNEIEIENISLQDAVASQGGGLRHRRTGLQARLFYDVESNQKVPAKRVRPSIDNIPSWRRKIIQQRRKMSALSLDSFRAARQQGDLEYFRKVMKEEIAIYEYLDARRYPDVRKKVYYDIALFGWHHQSNLGGVLTFFALHQLLKTNGFSIAVVWKPGKTNVTSGNRPNYEVLRKYYSYTKLRPLENLHELRAFCSMFVLASDQLWAGKWGGFHPEYEFLGCGDESVRKISVATSFGGEGTDLPFDESKAPIVKHLLRAMDHVSVREPNGIDILRSIGVESSQILDPVFLCHPGTYEELIQHSSIRIPEEPYVMAYILDAQKDVIDFSRHEVPERLGLSKTIFMTTMPQGDNQERSLQHWRSFGELDLYPNANVADFVYAMSRASFISTTSFHGACLAVIFHKPFICSPPRSRGNSRFELFKHLGLANRITSSKRLMPAVAGEAIDWDEVDRRLDTMREKSFAWLSNAFGRPISSRLGSSDRD